jgi:hypothetical protein
MFYLKVINKMKIKKDNPDFQRIEKVLDHLHYRSIQSFAEDIGINKVTLYSIRDGKHGISLAVAYAIVHKYPEINIDWLTVKKGNMLVDKEKLSMINESTSDYKKTCKECEQKNKIIDDLISDKKLLKRALEECLYKLNPAQKRKTA